MFYVRIVGKSQVENKTKWNENVFQWREKSPAIIKLRKITRNGNPNDSIDFWIGYAHTHTETTYYGKCVLVFWCYMIYQFSYANMLCRLFIVLIWEYTKKKEKTRFLREGESQIKCRYTISNHRHRIQIIHFEGRKSKLVYLSRTLGVVYGQTSIIMCDNFNNEKKTSPPPPPNTPATRLTKP